MKKPESLTTAIGRITRYVSTTTRTRLDLEAVTVEQIIKLHVAKALRVSEDKMELEWDASGEGLVRGVAITITEQKESTT